MNERQEAKYAAYAEQYAAAIKQSQNDPKAKMKALGILQRMALTAIQPELDQGPRDTPDDAEDEDEGGRTGRSQGNGIHERRRR